MNTAEIKIMKVKKFSNKINRLKTKNDYFQTNNINYIKKNKDYVI